MAVTQKLTIKYKNETTGTSFSKSFSNIPNGMLSDTDDAKTQINKIKKIVDGTFTGGELATVEPFDA